jgi:hypothetical protein
VEKYRTTFVPLSWRRGKRVEESVDIYAFLMEQLGMQAR